MTYNILCTYECTYSVYKVDYRGAAAPKNFFITVSFQEVVLVFKL